ncbi:RagB/SusD family nutrient uptake outer membrane protein [Marinilabiliaceae bacterium JC040]|nr:RagB/SusD family nutrient uptake outer membrane protein [Marinilabiliaceae bacterium JC040]
MKNKILVFVCLFALIASSCSDSILKKEPTSRLSGEMAFKNDKTLAAYMNGMYSQLAYRSGGSLYTMFLPLLGDILGEDMVFGNKWYQVYPAEYSFTSDANNSAPWQLWSEAYYAVEICDNLLNRDLSKVIDLDEAVAKRYKAEALVIRGMVMTDIARFFGKAYREDKSYKANPYVDKLLYNPKDPDDITYIKRNTVEEIYTKAIKDIKDAIALGLNNLGSASPFRITEQAAHAVLSRIYLDMAGEVGNITTEKKYLPLAKAEAEAAIIGTSLMSQKAYWEGGLSEQNSESILTFGIDKNKMSKWRVFHSFHDNYDGMADDFVADLRIVEGNDWFKTITKKFTVGGTDTYKTYGDMRQAFFVGEVIGWTKVSGKWVPLTYSKLMNEYKNFDASFFKTVKYSYTPNCKAAKKCGYYMYGKFPRKDRVMGNDRGTLALGDYTYIRASEMVLTIAECDARLGKTKEAIDNWKLIASRMWYAGNAAELAEVGDNSTTFDKVFENELLYTGTDLINLILKERRKELLGEGHRFRDILRLGIGVTRDLPGTGHYAGGKVNIPANSERLVFKAPQSEVDANPNISNDRK